MVQQLKFERHVSGWPSLSRYPVQRKFEISVTEDKLRLEGHLNFYVNYENI